MLTRLLLELRLPPNQPFDMSDAAFAVADFGFDDDLDGDLPDETLEAAPISVLPGCPHLIAIVSGNNGNAHREDPVQLAR